jgi:hypothetical protein
MGTLGVYRDGRILWAAPPDTFEYCERPTEVMAVRDLDQNDIVDIVFEWRGCYPTNLLWIYSWDGHTGTAMHENDRHGSSTIGVSRGYFDLADVNGDGTIDIIARTHRRVFEDDHEMMEPQPRVFSAKDGKYVEAAVQPDPSERISLPRDAVEGVVRAAVKRIGERLEYRYAVHNLQSSRQSVDEIHLSCSPSDAVSHTIQEGWDYYPHYPERAFLHWSASDSPANVISVGETDSSFSYRASGLPSIGTSYLRGQNTRPLKPVSDVIEDVRSNSTVGVTICAEDPAMPFEPGALLDTLRTYPERSASLGWLDGRGIQRSLEAKLDNARRELDQDNLEAAAGVLRTLASEVEAQRDKALSSEAYALLSFNAEYLIEHLESSDD